MQYLNIAIWFLVGIIVIVSMRKENKIFYLAGGYFIGLGVWSLLDVLRPDVDMFQGPLGIGVKVVSGIVFVILLAFFVYNYRKNLLQSKQEKAAEAAAHIPAENTEEAEAGAAGEEAGEEFSSFENEIQEYAENNPEGESLISGETEKNGGEDEE